MSYPVLPSVECAILHDEFKPIDGKILFAAITKLAQELNYAQEVQLTMGSSEKDIYVHAGSHRIMISQNAEPLGMDGFRNTLTTPYTGFVLPDATAIVQRHKANTFVTIAKGSIPNELTDKFSELMGDQFSALQSMNQFTTQEEAERAMILCRELTSLIINHHAASAIHWCTSDNLVPQSFFEAAAKTDDFSLLGARPFLSSSAGRLGEGLPVGAVFNGSQWLIGKMVSFEEAIVPFPWMMEVVMGFINICKIRGSIIPHNESFSVEGEDWTIGVYHEKIEGHDAWEMVKLVVVNAPQFGIHGDTSAKETFNYEDANDLKVRAEAEKREVRAANDVELEEPNTLDPEDDFDLAILKKLRSKAESKKEDNLAPQQQNFAQEPWKQPRQSTDLNALRELARAGLNPEQAIEDGDDVKSKSLLRKVVGVFSRK